MTFSTLARPRRWLMIVIPCAIALTLWGCGGGGGGSTQTAGEIGGGGTGYSPTIVVGPVNGFGSVVLAGVRYDDSATVRDIIDDDDGGTGLKLGMQVRMEGEVSKADSTLGKANRIEMRADMRGPVSSVGRSDRFEAMGMRVRINTGTVFDGVKADLSDLAMDDNIQVHGLFSDSRDLIATRVQKRAACAGAACVYKMIGLVQASSATQLTLDGGGSLTVNINGQTVISGLASPIPVGTVVRIKATAAPVNGVVTAATISAISAYAQPSGGSTPFETGRLEGIVTNVAVTNMVVNGTAVALSPGVVVSPAGTALQDGQRVKVEAKWVSGALQATAVTIDNGGQSGSGYEFFGPITNFVSSANFQVKGQTIDASGATVEFKNGTVTNLANAVNVEVRGQLTGTVLVANRVGFK